MMIEGYVLLILGYVYSLDLTEYSQTLSRLLKPLSLLRRWTRFFIRSPPVADLALLPYDDPDRLPVWLAEMRYSAIYTCGSQHGMPNGLLDLF